MFGTSARSGFRRGCGRASCAPPSDLVDQAHDSGALTDACTRKGPQMANPRPTPKPENLRPPWPPGTSGNPAGYSRGRRISDAIERLIEEMALDREFGATAIAMALGKKYMLKRKGVPGTPYLTAWANSGKSRREQALRLMAIGQARLKPLTLSPGHERTVNG